MYYEDFGILRNEEKNWTLWTKIWYQAGGYRGVIWTNGTPLENCIPLKHWGGGGGVTENGENNSCIHPWFQAQTQKLKKNLKITSKN